MMQQWFSEWGQGVLQGQAGVRASTHALITVALFLSFLAFAVPGTILFKHRVPVQQIFKNHYCKRIFNDQERHPRNDNQIRKESVCCVFGEKKKIYVYRKTLDGYTCTKH